MIKKVLVPLDGSPVAESILPYVELIARGAGAEITLLTSIQAEHSWDDEHVTVDMDAATAEASAYLESQCERLQAGGLIANVNINYGAEADAIIGWAAEEAADLIAMTTHGRTGLKRWILGSVAHKVLHGTSRPLLLVRAEEPGPRQAPQIDRILVPLDGSPLSLSILPYVEDLADALSANLVVYNAVPPLDLPFAAEVGPAPRGSAIDAMLDQGRSFTAAVAGEIEARGKVKAQSVVTVGFPVREIVQVSQDVNAGLIALATHGRSGFDRWVVGSVADGIVRRSGLPCLVVRPEEAAEDGQ